MSANLKAVTDKPARRKPGRPKGSTNKNPRKTPIASILSDRNRARATWLLGFVVPFMSLALSNMFGAFFSINPIIAGCCAIGVITILSVSLPHLVTSIMDISGTPKRLAWALAIAFDSGIVLAEVALTFVAEMPLLTRGICIAILVGATTISGLLNVWAFQLERKGKHA